MPRRILSYLKDKTETMSAYLPYENVYYEKIADYYKLIKYGMLVILAGFVLVVSFFATATCGRKTSDIFSNILT
jgi:hypothetical protein